MNEGALWQHSRHWLNLRPVYAFGEWILENLPLFVGYGITRGVTELAYGLSPNQRAGLKANVRQVLIHLKPGLSSEEREREVGRTVHRIFVNRGIWFADLSVMAGHRRLKDHFTFRVEGAWPALRRTLASGKGAILASAHLGNWHGGGVIVAQHGIPVRAVMYRNHAGDLMDQKVARRGNVKQTFVAPDPMSMMEILGSLRRGEVLAMLVDKPWDSRSVHVDFFGRPSAFPVGPVRIARMAEVPIFPAFCTWAAPRDYKAVLCDPIEVGGGDRDEAEREAVGRIAKVIERFVGEHLSVWFNFTSAWDAP